MTDPPGAVDERAVDQQADGADPADPVAPGATVAVDAAPLRVPVPVWLEVALLLAVTLVVCCGGFGLALAVIGHYSAGVSLGVGVPAAALLTTAGAFPLVGRGERRPDRHGGNGPALVAVVLAAGYAVWNVARSGDWMVIDRDAGAYAVTAKWLTGHGGLVVPFQSVWGGSGLPLQGTTYGVYSSGGTLEIQFNHLLPVVLAQAAALVGDRGILAGNAVLVTVGLLAVYVAGVRVTRHPWVVLAAVTGLAVSLPVLYVARASWSESVTMLLVWAGVWLLVTAWDRRSPVLALLAGLVVGGSVMGRVDALVYLAPLPVVAAVVVLVLATGERWRRFAVLCLAVVVGAAAPVVVGTADVEARAGFYYRDLADQIALLQKATLAAAVLGVVVLLLARPVRPLLLRVRRLTGPRVAPVAAALGVLASLLVVFAWALRPVLDHPTGAVNPLVGGLQAAEGVPVEPTRLYSEYGVVWLSWYLGVPAVALAVGGLGLLVRRAVRGAPEAIAVLGVTGAGAMFYLYRLSNTPDQLFGVRRFVPAVLPLFALAAATAVATLAWALARAAADRRWVRPVVGVTCLALVAFPVGASAPLRDMSPERGLLGAVDGVCSAVGPDAAIVFPATGYGQTVASQTFRSWCDVPVAGVTRALTRADLTTAAAYWAARGRTLWVVDAVPDALTGLFGASAVRTLGTVDEMTDATRNLTRAPDTYMQFTVTFYGTPVPR